MNDEILEENEKEIYFMSIEFVFSYFCFVDYYACMSKHDMFNIFFIFILKYCNIAHFIRFIFLYLLDISYAYCPYDIYLIII